MQKTNVKKTLSALVCAVLIAAMALGTFGCSNTKQNEPFTEVTLSATPSEVGNGSTKFTFKATDADGKTTIFNVSTDKKTVGEALQDAGVISGEEGAYGLYVKTVNGITLDYEKDGMYWAFYINDEMAMTGVDSTEIKDGEIYSFRAAK